MVIHVMFFLAVGLQMCGFRWVCFKGVFGGVFSEGAFWGVAGEKHGESWVVVLPRLTLAAAWHARSSMVEGEGALAWRYGLAIFFAP